MTGRRKLKIMLPKKRNAAQAEYNRPAALASHRVFKFPVSLVCRSSAKKWINRRQVF
jgi:hypothetical protein